MRRSLSAWWRADRQYHRACRLARAGKPGEGVRALDEVLSISPKHARAHAQRALALAAAGRAGEAVRAARRASELAPRSHAPLLFLGQIQFDAGHYEEARKAFSAAARLDPQNRLVQAYLGLALLATGRADQGAELLRANLLYGYEGLEGRLTTLAEQYLWEHRETARPLEDQLTADEGGREEGPAGLGLRLASAVRSIVLWPLARLRGQWVVWRLRADEAISVRDWRSAIGALQKAEEAGADPEEVALMLGAAYLEARDTRAAVNEFRRVSEEVRRESDVALLFGAALYDAEQYEEAREPLATATGHLTKDFLPSYLRGMCDIALGQPRAATQWFVQAAERLDPHIAEKRLEEMMRVRGEEAGGA
jgi:predicted Zn-dependent protease